MNGSGSTPARAKAPKGFLGLLARARRLREATPAPLRRCLRRFINRDRYLRNLWLALDPHRDAEEISTYPARVNVRLGIIREFTHAHRDYIGACRDLGVPYRLIDISTPEDDVRRAPARDDARHGKNHLSLF